MEVDGAAYESVRAGIGGVVREMKMWFCDLGVAFCSVDSLGQMVAEY